MIEAQIPPAVLKAWQARGYTERMIVAHFEAKKRKDRMCGSMLALPAPGPIQSPAATQSSSSSTLPLTPSPALYTDMGRVGYYRVMEIAFTVRVCANLASRQAVTSTRRALVLSREINAKYQIPSQQRRIPIIAIQKLCANFYQVTWRELLAHRRLSTATRARQVAIYLCKRLTTHSLPEIGRRFGGRDHTTILHSIRKIDRLVGEDSSFAAEVGALEDALSGGR